MGDFTKSHPPASTRTHPSGSGIQHKYKFDNGYGASVVRALFSFFGGSYGADQGLWELAVIGPDGDLAYDTPITNDVLGWLSDDQVAETLDAIAALPADNTNRKD